MYGFVYTYPLIEAVKQQNAVSWTCKVDRAESYFASIATHMCHSTEQSSPAVAKVMASLLLKFGADPTLKDSVLARRCLDGLENIAAYITV